MGNKNVITKDDCYLFGKGTHYEIYEKLGAHVTTIDGVKGTYFAVWAPHAVNVAVIGDFNDWLGFNHNMKMENDSGIWELFIPEVEEGAMYKYVISTQSGDTLYKADPYGFWAEKRPGNASNCPAPSGGAVLPAKRRTGRLVFYHGRDGLYPVPRPGH